MIRESTTLSEFEADIRQNAIAYRVHLFLGRGEYDRAEAGTKAGALALGVAMVAAHPECSRQPMFYAIDPAGRSTQVLREFLQTEDDMIKTKDAVKTHSNRSNAKRAIAAFRDKHPDMTETAIALVPRDGDRFSLIATLPAGAADQDVAACEAAGVEWTRLSPQIAEPDVSTGATPQAAKAAKKEARDAARAAAKEEVKQAKAGAKAAREAKKAAPPKASNGNGKIAHSVAEYGRDSERYAKALAGHLPQAPDFSANTHKPWRKKHAEIAELIKTRDLNGLKAFAIKPTTSSPTALYYWRNLAVLALEAKAS